MAIALYDVLAYSCILAIFLAVALASISCAEQAVPAQEFLNRIAADETVYFDCVSISDYLDLSAMPAAQVQESLALVNCTIANASFSGVTFDQDALFWGTTFGKVSGEGHLFLLGRLQ